MNSIICRHVKEWQTARHYMPTYYWQTNCARHYMSTCYGQTVHDIICRHVTDRQSVHDIICRHVTDRLTVHDIICRHVTDRQSAHTIHAVYWGQMGPEHCRPQAAALLCQCRQSKLQSNKDNCPNDAEVNLKVRVKLHEKGILNKKSMA